MIARLSLNKQGVYNNNMDNNRNINNNNNNIR